MLQLHVESKRSRNARLGIGPDLAVVKFRQKLSSRCGRAKENKNYL